MKSKSSRPHWRRLLRKGLAAALACMLLSACGSTGLDPAQLNGRWSTTLPPEAGNGADLTLDFAVQEDGRTRCLATSVQLGVAYAPMDLSLEDGRCALSLEQEGCFPLRLTLGLDTEGHLFSHEPELLFQRKGEADSGEFQRIPSEMDTYTLADRIEQLKRFPEQTAGTGIELPFTYELGNREAIRLLDEEYGFAEAMAGKSDLNAMLAALNCTCDHFAHNGMSGVAPVQSAEAVALYSREQGGVNCWNLSILLAEVLRAYGIPAKPISCLPIEQSFTDNHVVVHAYSASRKQWILLDPTYRLILIGPDGRYVDLPTLREMLISGEEPIPNAEAGWNGTHFYIDEYCSYMAKNCFRFESPLEARTQSSARPSQAGYAELVPEGYADPLSQAIVTSDADAFWALPEE